MKEFFPDGLPGGRQITFEAALIVDDDRDFLRSVGAFLESEGYRVDTAETMASALEKMKRRSYRLFIVNVGLPDLYRLDLPGRLEEMASSSLKIIIDKSKDDCVAVGPLNLGSDQVIKPVQLERLLNVVKKKVEERRRGDLSINKDMVTIVLPVLNEEDAIGLVVQELQAEGYKYILVVDGYSVDNTVKIARGAGASVIKQHGNGKTGALMTAFEHVKTPYLLVMDGDHTYSARDIEKFLPFARRYDQILGHRRIGRHNISRLHRLGNWIINKALSLLIGSHISDVCTGMYMLKTETAKKLEMNSRGFNVEVEIAIQNLTYGAVTEVPITYRKRIGKRKLTTWRQGFQILWTIVKRSFSYNPLFFLTALGSMFTLPGAAILLQLFYNRLRFGERGWSIGRVWLGSTLFMVGLNFFTIAMISLSNKRQEHRILREIRAMAK